MSKQPNPSQSPVITGPSRPTTNDGPETWGQWSGRRHYSLEVVQHPLRARMCGFGDKDRRPLAPAAVAKMIVRSQDNSIVDVDDVDSSFFLVTVDLWSADGKQEMNLVLHPSSADRYPPPPPAKTVVPGTRRRTTSQSSRPPGNQTPAGTSTPTPVAYHTGEPSSNSSNQVPYYSSPPSLQDGLNNYPPNAQVQHYRNTSSDQPPSWVYQPAAPPVDRTTRFPPPILPSIQSFNRNNSGSNSEPWNSESESYLDPVLRNPPPSSSTRASESRENTTWNQSSSDGYNNNASDSPQTSLSRNATYTRTLVGPLSANACRLLDEHRKPGIFFLFQDLSVRTEGTFRLRMRLMNVGAPPAPEAGAIRVHNEISPVLAQTFTEPFTVYSAKRFPGVPDTTALSIAFGNQGQKLPLRNRHGTGTSKRRRRGDSESEGDSDDS